ncbi:MAG TPA: hypothetical protein VFB74_28685 [Kribbellaceae bacterium]|nr:hypothetical protein [Kribbellaceae bacterium]
MPDITPRGCYGRSESLVRLCGVDVGGPAVPLLVDKDDTVLRGQHRDLDLIA